MRILIDCFWFRSAQCGAYISMSQLIFRTGVETQIRFYFRRNKTGTYQWGFTEIIQLRIPGKKFIKKTINAIRFILIIQKPICAVSGTVVSKIKSENHQIFIHKIHQITKSFLIFNTFHTQLDYIERLQVCPDWQLEGLYPRFSSFRVQN